MVDLQPAPPPESGSLMRALAGHPEQTANLIEALHRRAVDADTLLDLMGRISREAVRLLDGFDWAGVTAQIDGAPMTAASTGAQGLVVDEWQYAAGDGPCLRAMRTGSTVAMDSDQVAVAWPTLASAARDVGVRSFLAIPLYVQGRSVGALNLYSTGRGVPVPDPDFLTVLTEYAGRGFTDYRTHQPLPFSGEQLRSALAQWSVVEQAIGVLMEAHGFSIDYAADVLADQAQDWNRTLRDQAAYIISKNGPSDGDPPH